MEVPSIIVVDTNGGLTKDLFKVNLSAPAISAWLSNEVGQSRTLNVALDNARISSLPNIASSTYITFLAYNGTLGYSKKVFSSVVKTVHGILDTNDIPVISYDPNTVLSETIDTLDDVVIDIKMYNGVVDVLRYAEGALNNGEKSYFVKSRRSFPTTITELPNVSGKRVFMDGWYTYTTIIFRNITNGAAVYKDTFYGVDGFIFKASDNGTMMIDNNGDIFILLSGTNVISQGVKQSLNTDYGQLLFSLNETTGTSAQSNNVYAHSQILVTDQIRDAIINEAVDAAYMDATDYVDFQTWQKLSLKRMAASVMFQNELFENAQIIMESARSICVSGKYNSNCR